MSTRSIRRARSPSVACQTAEIIPRTSSTSTSGHIIQVSSIGGVNAFPMVGLYHASKWGLEGFSQSLAQEVAAFGIKVTLVEPTGFSTDWSGPSAAHAEPLPAYADYREQVQAMRKARIGTPGDPDATGPAILKVVDADEPPLRAFFGVGLLDQIRAARRRASRATRSTPTTPTGCGRSPSAPSGADSRCEGDHPAE